MEHKTDRGQIIQTELGQVLLEWMIIAFLTCATIHGACQLMLEGMKRWKESELNSLKL